MSEATVIHIVDDNRAVRDSLGLLVSSAGWQQMTYESAEDFLENYNPACPGCLVLDVRMPGMSGVELLKLLPEKGIHLPVVMISGHADIALAVQALKSGAMDFIEKPFDDEVFIGQLEECLQAIDLIKPAPGQTKGSSHLERLTCREREVLDLLVSGKSNKATAAILGISVRTVEVHRAKIMDKLETKSLADVIRMVLAP